MNRRTLSSKIFNQFVQTATSELGQENLSSVLEKGGLPSDWSNSARWVDLSGTNAAEAYAGLQKAMRTYYGRGARGILIRVGQSMWTHLLDEAPLTVKAQAKVLFGLPVSMRRKPALEILARLISDRRGDVKVHTLDLDLLLADLVSPGTLGQAEPTKICYVTQGLLRECLYWATGQEHDIEETSCRANGEEACEFKITIGG